MKKWRVGGHSSLEETTETNASPFPPDFENPEWRESWLKRKVFEV